MTPNRIRQSLCLAPEEGREEMPFVPVEPLT